MSQVNQERRKTRFEINRLIGIHQNGILVLEKECYEHELTELTLHRMMVNKKTLGVVAVDEDTGVLLGYVIYRYSTRDDSISILRLGVDPNHRRMGIGKKLVKSVINRMVDASKGSVRIVVGEHNLPAQLMLRSKGFICSEILRYGSGDESYKMVLRLEWV